MGKRGAHAAVSRRPPISLPRIVARTEGYTYAAKVWALCLVQAPFSVAPCQTLIVRFAIFSPLYVAPLGVRAVMTTALRPSPPPSPQVLAATDMRYIVWDIDELLQLMRTDKNLHSAFMEVLYGTLIHTLRADRDRKKAELREVRGQARVFSELDEQGWHETSR